jgi:hypothetical protein
MGEEKIQPGISPPTAQELVRSYKALVKVLKRDRSLGQALAAYAIARRTSAGETLLMPEVDEKEIHVIRGKAQFMTELLTLCEAAKQPGDDDEDEGEEPA